MKDRRDGSISLRDHFDALRATDFRLYLMMRAADQRYFDDMRSSDQRALAAALASVAKATEVLAESYKADKSSQNEWRGTVNDIISAMKGQFMLISGIVVLVGLAFTAFSFFRK